jgi:DNA repair/transcription protein MET18/MMS19
VGHTSSPLATYVKAIVKECNDYFDEPAQRQAKTAGKMIATVAASSDAAFLLVIQGVLPPSLTKFQDADNQTKRRALIEILNLILDSALGLYGDVTAPSRSSLSSNPLLVFKDTLYELLSRTLMGSPKDQVSLRLASLQGLLKLAKMTNFLSLNEAGIVIQHLNELALEDDTLELQKAALDGLVEIARSRHEQITSITFPQFLSRLPEAGVKDRSYELVLEALARLSVHPELGALLIRRLMSKLDTIGRGAESDENYLNSILATILYVLDKKENWDEQNSETLLIQVVRPLTSSAISSAMVSATPNDISKPVALDIIGKISNITIRHLSPSRQGQVAQSLIETFVYGKSTEIAQFNTEGTLFNPFQSQDDHITSFLTVFAHSIAGLRKDVSFPLTKAELFELLATRAKTISNGPAVQSSLRLLSLLTNKWTDIEFSTFLQTQITSLKTDSGQDIEPKASAIDLQLLFWITKALVVRADPKSDPLLDHLLIRLGDNTAEGRIAARGFSMLLAPEELLSKSNYAVIRLLHKQRLFNFIMPRLSEKFKSVEAQVKPNYLIAVSGILRHVDSTIIMDTLPTLLPLLLQSLDVADVDVRQATIETLTVVISENASAVESYASNLIPRLIKAAALEEGNPPVSSFVKC